MRYRLLLFLLLFTRLHMQAQTTLFVLSDTHVLAPEYTAQLGDAHSSGMLSALSSDLLVAAVDSAIAWYRGQKQQETYLLLTGDMTYNGEEASHRFVSRQLARLKAAGIQPLVIPGNHDLLNKYARNSKTADGTGANSVDRPTYRALYAPYGYVEADAVQGLCYVRRMGRHLALICLDDALDDGGNTYYSDGALSPATLNWMLQQARQLRSEGRTILAAVHHHLLEHHMHELELAGSRMLNATAGNNCGVTTQQVQQAFADAGIHYVLTGHFHAQDAQQTTLQTSEGNDHLLFDISTGSLASGGNYMRTLRFSDQDTRMDITSTHIQLQRDAHLLRQRGINDWSETQTFRAYADSVLQASNDAFTHQQIQSRAGSLAGMLKPLLEPLSEALDRFYMGDDASGRPLTALGNKLLLGMLRMAKPDLYSLFDSMIRNFATTPQNVTPDLNLLDLPVQVAPTPANVFPSR